MLRKIIKASLYSFYFTAIKDSDFDVILLKSS